METTAATESLSLDEILLRLDGGRGPASAVVNEVLLALAADAVDEVEVESEDLVAALRAAGQEEVADRLEALLRAAGSGSGMAFVDLESNWTRFGEIDPLWSILTDPSKQNNGWDVEEFLTTGRRYAEQLMGYLAAHRIEVRRGRALDFGCGVGRLTQALCAHFDQAVGVDIAATMIQRAREINTHGERCTYVHNSAQDLSVFPDASFDLVNCHIVLQHMRPEFALGYVAEFLRVLRPGGLAVFQVPTEPFGSVETEEEEGRLSTFAAEILAAEGALHGAPGTKHALRLTVRNTGPERWLVGRTFPVNVGNHWLDAHGRMLIQDDMRARVPGPVEPGEAVEMEVWVTLPETAGDYVLELDVVQERVAWFGSHGSPTLRLPVRAGGEAAEPAALPASPARADSPAAPVVGGPRMEMFGTPPERIVSWVARHRGRVLVMEQDWSADDWYGYRYFVEKR